MAKALRKKRANTEAHDEKRLEIIMHCANLFDKVGYHKASMQMLADEVGLGKPTLYHYFKSKSAILYAIHELHMDALIQGLEELSDPSLRPSELLRHACAGILRQIAEHPGYVRAFMDHYTDLEGDMRKEIRRRRNEYFARIESILERGIAAGDFAPCDIELTAYAFLGMCNWAYKWYPSMQNRRPPEEVAKALCDVFLQGLEKH